MEALALEPSHPLPLDPGVTTDTEWVWVVLRNGVLDEVYGSEEIARTEIRRRFGVDADHWREQRIGADLSLLQTRGEITRQFALFVKRLNRA